MYFTDRGTGELDERRGEEQVALHRGPRILIIGGGYGGLHTAPRLERLLRPGEATVLERPRRDFQAALDVITQRPSRAAPFQGRRQRGAEHHAYHQ